MRFEHSGSEAVEVWREKVKRASQGSFYDKEIERLVSSLADPLVDAARKEIRRARRAVSGNGTASLSGD